jgi:DNA topoisomerase-1
MAGTSRKKGPDNAKQGSGAAARGEGGAGKKLVVVESPAKAKTINRYLGSDYIVKASMGHVRDLPVSEIGVDLEHDFEPTYKPLNGRGKVLTELKKYARSAPMVYLATDLDREGEAIAWHVAEALKLPDSRVQRVVFNEITSGAIREAFEHPRGIDMNKVNAQQARRILDRIVGYQVSPLLWKKIARGLSAGRVQTVAVRLIVERERQIEAFMPEEYWKISAIFTSDLAAADRIAGEYARFCEQRDEKGNPPTVPQRQEKLSELNAFTAELVRWRGERFRCDGEETALSVAAALGLEIDTLEKTEDPEAKGPARNRVSVLGHVSDQPPSYRVASLNQRDSRSKPPPPFTTATLQQTASVQLYFNASRTMRVAQQLYEGVEIPGEGTVGLITYMRTDSRHLSREAIGQGRELIRERFGGAYLPDKPNVYSSSERAQEAHEAIRPTDVLRDPDRLMNALSNEQYKLYRLIWRRFLACQMAPAVWKVTETDIVASTSAGEATFKAMGRTLSFDGYLRVAGLPRGGEQILPPLEVDMPLAAVEIDPSQHFTQPPPRYTEASLVKALEAENIGRPSTYAAIIQTIQDREYVRMENRSFRPTELGKKVVDKLVRHFPREFEVRFTAHMEDELDKVEEARADWVEVLRQFYGPFSEDLEKASENMVHAKAETEPSEYVCESCGKPMVYRWSRNGRYLACTGYPECRETHPVDEKGRKVEQQVADVACPECSSPMILRRGRFGPFLSCCRYPDCSGVVNLDRKGNLKHPAPPPLTVDVECTKCGAPMYLRRGKRGPWLSCSKFPKCRGRVGWTTLSEEKRAELETRLAEHEKAHPVSRLKQIDGTEIVDDQPPQILDNPPPLPQPTQKPEPSKKKRKSSSGKGKSSKSKKADDAAGDVPTG